MVSKKQNCWEFMRCDFGPEAREDSCPVVSAVIFNGINGGINGGRYCWNVENAFCLVGSESLNESEPMNCATCEFYRFVKEEEGKYFKA
jgi:hypothetical protein